MRNVMSWIKSILVFLFLSLCTLKVADLAFYAVLQSDGNWDELRSGKRNIQPREHDPNQDVNILPGDLYMEQTDGLIKKEYKISIDENGFIRNSNPPITTEDMTIAFIGGSTTETIYVDEKNRFPSVVERQLRNKLSKNIRTINAGVSGNNSLHSLLNFLAKILPQNPDIAILMNNINDFAQLSKTGSYWIAPSSRSLITNTENSQQLTLNGILRHIKNLMIPNLYNYIKPRLFPGLVISDEFSEYRDKRVNENSSKILTMFESSLKSFVEVCNAWGVKPILMTQFNRININDPLYISWITEMGFPNEAKDVEILYSAMNEVVRKVAAETNTDLIDLANQVPRTSDFIYDVVHVNDKGSRLVGDIISKKIVEILGN